MATTKKKHYKDYQDYLQSPEWRKLRKKTYTRVKKEYGDTVCEVCGLAEEKTYNVHHWKYPKNWVDDNTDYHVLLCQECHKKWHEIYNYDDDEFLSRADFLTSFSSREMNNVYCKLGTTIKTNNELKNVLSNLIKNKIVNLSAEYDLDSNRFVKNFRISGFVVNTAMAIEITELLRGVKHG